MGQRRSLCEGTKTTNSEFNPEETDVRLCIRLCPAIFVKSEDGEGKLVRPESKKNGGGKRNEEKTTFVNVVQGNSREISEGEYNAEERQGGATKTQSKERGLFVALTRKQCCKPCSIGGL